MRSVPAPAREADTVAAVRPASLVGAAQPSEPALRTPDSGVVDVASPYHPGAVIAGRYRLERKLGRGGMGEVWSAHHLALHTEVALKFPSVSARGRTLRIVLERFRFEAQIAAQLGLATPHVVAVRDAGTDETGPYLVMEYVRGRTLRAVLDEDGVLPLGRVADLVEQVAEALAVAHAYGVAHRDLKPSNLLLVDRPDGATLVKVADFGIAKALHADLAADLPEDTTGGFMIGSPAYMSPEQMGGVVASTRGDLWALAVIAYEALTGKLPFDGRSFTDLIVSLATGRFELPSTRCPELPSAVDGWFRRALARVEGQRFGSAREMARALRGIADARPRRSSRRLPWLAFRLSFLAGLCALGPASDPDPDSGAPARLTAPARRGASERQASSGNLG